MKCIVCEKRQAKLWFNLMNVCQECYNRLIERKIELQNQKEKQK